MLCWVPQSDAVSFHTPLQVPGKHTAQNFSHLRIVVDRSKVKTAVKNIGTCSRSSFSECTSESACSIYSL